MDALPVLADATAIEPARPAPLAVQAAAVAATTFVAGAATIAIARRIGRGGLRRRRRKRALGQVVATRSFLVDVHVLDR